MINLLQLFYQKIIYFLELFENKDSILISDLPKVALVKQYVYADLYSKNKINCSDNWLETIYTSNHRSGPIAIFSKLDADFFIVDVFEEKICNVFKEKGANIKWDKFKKIQKKEIINPNNINWNNYDLVICIENAVPSKITKKYPRVLWATMLEHHRMKSYSKYKRRLPDGYNLFFNQRFGPTPFSFFKKNYVIDWPYGFNQPLNLKKTFGIDKKEDAVVIDVHSLDYEIKNIIESHNLKINMTSKGRSIKEHLFLLSKTKYLILPIKFSERMLWGNITLEASALSCLIIGNKKYLWNPHLILKECHVTNYNQFKTLLFLLDDKSYYNTLLKKQNKLLNYFGYVRPLNQLSNHLNKKNA
jgi:hypothetical protein